MTTSRCAFPELIRQPEEHWLLSAPPLCAPDEPLEFVVAPHPASTAVRARTHGANRRHDGVTPGCRCCMIGFLRQSPRLLECHWKSISEGPRCAAAHGRLSLLLRLERDD